MFEKLYKNIWTIPLKLWNIVFSFYCWLRLKLNCLVESLSDPDGAKETLNPPPSVPPSTITPKHSNIKHHNLMFDR